MSQYIYAIIPYKSGISFSESESMPCVWAPILPQLDNVDSELTDPEGLVLFADFLQINTCYRQSVFTNNKDGYSWLRTEIYKIAKALDAKEVWSVEEPATDEMELPNFSFDSWKESLKTSGYVAELTTVFLKGNVFCSYYHDDFSDIINEAHGDLHQVDKMADEVARMHREATKLYE